MLATVLEVIRDPAWQFGGILVGTIVSVCIYLWGRDRRELAFGVIYNAPVLATSKKFAGGVTVNFKGQEVENVHAISLALKNSGRKAVVSSDFERPIAFKFGATARVLSFEVSATEPANLDVHITLQDDGLYMRPLLLNPGDHIVVNALVSAATPMPAVDARISGIQRFAALIDKAPDARPTWAGVAGALAFSLAIAAGGFVDPPLAMVVFVVLFFTNMMVESVAGFLVNARGRTLKR